MLQMLKYLSVQISIPEATISSKRTSMITRKRMTKDV